MIDASENIPTTNQNKKHQIPGCSGVSRILFRGGGGVSKLFWKSGGICMASRHAARGEVTRLLGGSGACSHEKNF